MAYPIKLTCATSPVASAIPVPTCNVLHKDFFLATNLRSKLNCGGGYLNRYHSHDSLHPNNDHMVVNNESRNNNFDKFPNNNEMF